MPNASFNEFFPSSLPITIAGHRSLRISCVLQDGGDKPHSYPTTCRVVYCQYNESHKICVFMTFTGPSKPKIKIAEKPRTIEAHDQSPITLTIADNVTALTNTSITIHCPTSGVPTPTVTWTKDGEQIPGNGRYTVQDDGSLLISEASEEDNARYTCTANSVAGKVSASSTAQIVGKGNSMILYYLSLLVRT